MCSLMEAVLLSVPHSYVAVMEKNDPKAGKQFRILKTKIDRPLAAILSLNTIAHTVGAAGAGAQAGFCLPELSDFLCMDIQIHYQAFFFKGEFR